MPDFSSLETRTPEDLTPEKIIVDSKKLPQEDTSKGVFIKNSKIMEPKEIPPDRVDREEETWVVDSGLDTAREMMILKILEAKGVKGCARVIRAQGGYVAFKRQQGGYYFTSAALEKIDGKTWSQHEFKKRDRCHRSSLKGGPYITRSI